jgi:hypothetical protein
MFGNCVQIGSLRCTGPSRCVRLGGSLILLALENKKNIMRDIKSCTTERIQFKYPGTGGKINRRTGVAKINSQGEKYDMYWGTPSILISRGEGNNQVGAQGG